MVSVQLRKSFTGPPLCGGWVKELQTFLDVFFRYSLSKNCIVEFTAVFVCLLLSWSSRHSMKWSSNFDGPWFQQLLTPIPPFFKYGKFLPKYLIQQKFKMSPIFILNKKPPKKTQMFHFFQGLLFRNEWLYWFERWRVLRDFCRRS